MHLKELLFAWINEGRKTTKYSLWKSAKVETEIKLSAHLGTVPELNEVKQEGFNGLRCILDQGS